MTIRKSLLIFCKIHLGIYKWSTNNQPPKTIKEVPATTPLSDTNLKDLKNGGFNLGSTVIYAHMQAAGMSE
jgi:DNA-3-methyladenine glycosylase I